MRRLPQSPVGGHQRLDSIAVFILISQLKIAMLLDGLEVQQCDRSKKDDGGGAAYRSWRGMSDAIQPAGDAAGDGWEHRKKRCDSDDRGLAVANAQPVHDQKP